MPVQKTILEIWPTAVVIRRAAGVEEFPGLFEITLECGHTYHVSERGQLRDRYQCHPCTYPNPREAD